MIFFQHFAQILTSNTTSKNFDFAHLIYFLIFNRHSFLELWIRINFFICIIYFSVNFFFTILKAKSIFETKMYVGALTLINMMSFFFDLHLSFFVDLCDISFKTYWFIRAVEALMSFLLIFVKLFVCKIRGTNCIKYNTWIIDWLIKTWWLRSYSKCSIFIKTNEDAEKKRN